MTNESTFSAAPFQTIVIVGAGQVGTSLVRAIMEALPNAEIIALDRPDAAVSYEESFNAALAADGHASDKIAKVFTRDPSRVKGADLVILATPVDQFGTAIEAIAPHLSASTILSDTGSTKGESINRILAALKVFAPHLIERLVAIHPMNGNAGSGPETSDKNLVKGKPVFVVPDHASPEIVEAVTSLYRDHLQANTVSITAAKHDALVATMSHLEHLIMFSFMQTDFIQKALKDGVLNDPGDWIKFMTRIADANPAMWAPIFKDNRDELLKTAKTFKTEAWKVCRTLDYFPQDIPYLAGRPHHFAKQMIGTRIKDKIDRKLFEEASLPITAFAGLLSLVIARNVKITGTETKQDIPSVANPSLKDGLGPVAVDPVSVIQLITKHKAEMGLMMSDFMKNFSSWIRDIKNWNSASLSDKVTQVQKDRLALSQLFERQAQQQRPAFTPQQQINDRPLQR